jgi:enamine deaminase RidA (YjgF/YER057c/UK114 family)
MEYKKEHINPGGLFKSPAFSQVVTTQGNGKTIYIGGQNAVNKNMEIIGKGSLSKQTEQVMLNLTIALEACGATFNDLVKLNINLLQGQDAREGFEASQKFMGTISNPPIVTVLFVSGLGHPDYLVEIDAIAFVPEK